MGTPAVSWALRRPRDFGRPYGLWSIRVAPQLKEMRALVRDLVRGHRGRTLLSGSRSLDDVVERTVLATNELATNAIKYGEGEAAVRLSRIDGAWLIDVTDHNTSDAPEPSVVDDRPHGLDIVAAVSDDHGWWVESGGGTKHVWALVPDHAPHALRAALGRRAFRPRRPGTRVANAG